MTYSGRIQAPRPLLCSLIASVACAVACGHAAPPATPAAPTTGSIAGIVSDQSTGDPLSFARIEATEWATKRTLPGNVSTQGDGTYQLADLTPGTYLIEVRYAEHRVRFFAVPVHVGETTPLDVRIDASALDSNASYDYVDMLANPIVAAPSEGPATESTASRSGGIRGLVRDQASKQMLPGAVVAATTPGLRDAQLAIADDDGAYILRGLPPGTYTLSVYYHLVERGTIEVRRTGVDVTAGEVTVIDLDLDAQIEH